MRPLVFRPSNQASSETSSSFSGEGNNNLGGFSYRGGVNRGMERRPIVDGGPTPVFTGSPLAQPASFKKGGKVKKTGWAKVHKGETVIPKKHDGIKNILGGKKRKAKSKASKKRISTKIRVLRKEGVKQDQAVAMSISMEKKHRLTNSGGYKRVKK
jgi:hypothetical protein